MQNELGSFLKVSRARVAPEERGLPTGTRRRVNGLRRMEVALLAGVSVDYYVRLEQGRAETPSLRVLRAIAQVLGLDAMAYEHLIRLARPYRGVIPPRIQKVRSETRSLLDAMHQIPALVAGRGQEILYANRLGDALLPSSYPGPTRNVARHVFLSPDALSYYADWDAVAVETVATLRHESGKYPEDPVLWNLVGELSIASPAFVELWAHQDVHLKTNGRRRINHPYVGNLQLNYEFLRTGLGGELIVTYTPNDRTTADAFILLDAITKTAAAA
ncbi:helix-turn-helix transcriptional regulator [Streptomyces phaeochromogenes]|uniref:helix-turn-helix domain-containing protein n=1 Tax=Streptomyces phaeochromogenes TaxID=1923 RepID=UPI0033CD889D